MTGMVWGDGPVTWQDAIKRLTARVAALEDTVNRLLNLSSDNQAHRGDVLIIRRPDGSVNAQQVLDAIASDIELDVTTIGDAETVTMRVPDAAASA